MSESLISSLTTGLGADFINRVAVDNGASEARIGNGFRAAIAAIVGCIVSKADDQNVISQVFDLVAGGTSASTSSSRRFNQDTSATEPGSPLMERGQSLLSTIFGGSQSSVVQGISQQSELPSNIVARIMGMAAPMVLSALARRVKDSGTSLSGFPNLLLRETGDVSSYLPASVNNLLRPVPPTLDNFPARIAPPSKESSLSGGRILSICVIAALLVGIFWFLRRPNSTVATTDRSEGVSRARASIPELGGFLERELPGGVRITVPENGMESKLIAYIQDPTRRSGKDEWFDFDRVTFETNSAIPKPESEEQLTNLSSILKAYPQVRLKVGGYTDNIGDRQANQRLSEQRAESVRRELVGLDIASSRVEAEGYGDQHAVANNATEQGRARNRRISVKVLQK